MKMLYEKDTDIDLIKSKKIAIFGFGSQGHAHALNLKDSGVKEVVVALRDGSTSKQKAEAQGLKVMNLSDAAEWADILMMLTPDELQSQIYKNPQGEADSKKNSLPPQEKSFYLEVYLIPLAASILRITSQSNL